jgi:hypothetical protein
MVWKGMTWNDKKRKCKERHGMPRKDYERNDMAWNRKVRHHMERHGISWKCMEM